MSRRRKEEDMEMSSEEAKEEQERVEESDDRPISEEEGEDLLENADRDYEVIEALDKYENEGLDEEEYFDDLDARVRADKEIEQRYRLREGQKDELDEMMDEEEEDLMKIHQRRFQILRAEEEDEEIDERRYLDAEDNKGKLPEWINEEETLKYIKTKFTRFLTQFKPPDDKKSYPIYVEKIRNMAISNQQSFEISFAHLKTALPTIAIWVGLHPALMLPRLNDIAYAITCRNYQSFKTMVPEIFVKIVDLPFIDQIRDLRYTHLGKLVKVKGVITIRSEVFNQMKRVFYKCTKCGQVKGPFHMNEKNQIRLGQCSSCQSSGPFLVDKARTIYRNHQKMTMQESPSEVLPGRIPRNKEIIVFGDNVDQARPGDQVEVTGIFTNHYDCVLNVKQGFPLFATLIEAIHISKVADTEMREFDNFREELFRDMAKDPELAEKIYGSIAPSIYGHHSIKRALALAMFGGEAIEEIHRVRGDINVLLLGDPGTAKSQFLKSVQKVFHRCIYTTGKGASAVGLTASVKRDFQTNEWKLEAGALVLADRGLCLIDEFDKMNEHDRTSIHEAMEQQSISISKAGIVTSLRARCSVIAAANPLQGRYNSQLSFQDNVDLSEPILSRFDILNVVKDEVDESIDHYLSTFVINSHIKNHPYTQKYHIEDQALLEGQESILPYIQHTKLKQYIKYAREKCHPKLSDKSHEIIKTFFKEIRSASKKYGGMHISIRQIESIIRIATAHAKMHLRGEVEKQDIDIGIGVLLESFIQTQKHSSSTKLKKDFSKYLLDYRRRR